MIQTALITGASSGIGYELAKCFARDHIHLVLVARDEARLNRIAAELTAATGVSTKIIAADLSRATAPQEIYWETQRVSIAVDYLVNNAGFGFAGPFLETDLTAELSMLQVNVASVVHLTKLYIADMRQRSFGGILNVASTAAFQPGPFMATYFAGKAFVLSFTEALAEELRDTGLTATALCPGPTATEFARRAKLENPRHKNPIALHTMSASDVAEIGYRAFREGKPMVIPGWINQALTQSVRLSPRALTRRITGKYQQAKLT